MQASLHTVFWCLIFLAFLDTESLMVLMMIIIIIIIVIIMINNNNNLFCAKSYANA